MGDPPLDSPLARPVDSPAGPPTVALAAYPSVALSRSAALSDLAIIVAVLGMFTALSLFTRLPLLFVDWLPRGGMYLWVLANGLLSLLTIGVLLRRHRQGVASVGVNHVPVGRILVSTVLALPACFAAGAISNIAVTVASGSDIESFARDRVEFFGEVSNIPIGWILPIALFVGIYEEILFRGFALSRLRVLCGSNAAAIVVTSIAFGMVHFEQGLTGMIQTGLIGLILATVATYTGSLWPAILTHASIDTLSLVVSAVFRDDMQEFLRQLTTTAPAP